ncbi:hypothetical protein CANCADRAFT_30533 [Tortispora caseinolytica NRRL Y-17796]|uniref:Pre-mRNA-splicing factor SYF1 n=1 Tax=Tortispora caseinolytica NRRL Y-17796 TaxID=767744 RepID=A0A1E4TKU4_9ASCO|nr:hypothetical protein CANCADRAFT_30533 [Tortispora caseinolytica NRRL Y-17796]
MDLDRSDIPYELDVLQHPDSLNAWLRYINHLQSHNRPARALVVVFERACTHLDRSYKLWKLYLDFRVQYLKGVSPIDNPEHFTAVNNCYENALTLLYDMPVLWLDYIAFLQLQPSLTQIRHTFDRALRSLPVSQHHLLWPSYLEFAETAGGKTFASIWSRYVQFAPKKREILIEKLQQLELYTDAASNYRHILSDKYYKSHNGKSMYQLHAAFAALLVHHEIDLPNFSTPAFIRQSLHKFPDQTGKLYTDLAKYYIANNNLERARDTFKEALSTVTTVRDFVHVFEAYTSFQELEISKLMSQIESSDTKETELESLLDLRMFQFEETLSRRLLLLSDVRLRQDANNVQEWIDRFDIVTTYDAKVQVFVDAIEQIDPKNVHGNLSELWVLFAHFYESFEEFDNARAIYNKATNVFYRSPHELSDIWIEWAKFEIRLNRVEAALEVLKTATSHDPNVNIDFLDSSIPSQQRLHKSIKLWTFYASVVEATGSIDAIKSVNDQMFTLKIATVGSVARYAQALQDYGYFEDSFKVYEQGIAIFAYPAAFELWNVYLIRAMERNLPIERMRQLFEQALIDCPAELSKYIYIAYALYEEQNGLFSFALKLIKQAVEKAVAKDKVTLLDYYIGKCCALEGVDTARKAFEFAIQQCADKDASMFCLRYAEAEIAVNEIARAREIFKYGTQLADPRIDSRFWETFKEFEETNGDEESIKEMIRLKESVEHERNTSKDYVFVQARNALEQDRQPVGFVKSNGS